jgi:inhibitor of KinA
MTVTPLGDQAVLVELPDEPAAVALAAAVRTAAPDWLLDVVPAYSRAGVFFDPDRATVPAVAGWLRGLTASPPHRLATRTHTVPVCYERGPDLAHVTGVTGLSADRVIALHSADEYTVYAVGFVPGFAYLGYLPAGLCGVGRLASPRVRVDPGMVGVTGRQTGVYPLPRPGGWPLVGQTPLTLVDVTDGYFPLRVGDRVRFARIDEAEFTRRHGERL